MPLFSLRGTDDVGCGQILDLIPFIDWLHRWHHRIVQLLPLNEAAPREASPYNTLSAFAIDPAYVSALRVVDVARSAAARSWLATPKTREQRRRLRAAPARRRHGSYAFTLRLLAFAFDEFEAHAAPARRAAFEAFRRQHSWWLDDYALFRALKEQYRWRSWETWPAPLRRRAAQALERAAARLRARVRFFQYVQWVAAEQWAQVRAHARRRGVLLKGDLPFVCGRDSADVWAQQTLFDPSSSAGAPPDAFSATGQAWGLPLYEWAAMRASGYGWWRRRMRHARDLYDLVRVDHVVGLFRTYAIPTRAGGTAGFVPPDEDVQRQQGSELMAALVEEAGTATGVVAEDLGTVPDWVRACLTHLGIPGYKVFRWERHDGDYVDPRSYAPLSVATTGTHDTDTLVDWWSALHPDERRQVLRLIGAPDVDGACQQTSLAADTHLALLRRIYEAGSLLTVLPIQDILGWNERINVPASTAPRNWTFRLPVAADLLDQDEAIRARMAAVRDLIDACHRAALSDVSP